MPKHTVPSQGGAMAPDSRKTRRAALRTLVGAGILAIPAVIPAEQADPIFAAIERHKVAWATVDALSPTVDDVPAKRMGGEVSQADREAYKRATLSEAQALDELLATPPMTAAGMRAAIEYLIGFDDGCLSDTARPLLATFLKSPLFAFRDAPRSQLRARV